MRRLAHRDGFFATTNNLRKTHSSRRFSNSTQLYIQYIVHILASDYLGKTRRVIALCRLRRASDFHCSSPLLRRVNAEHMGNI